MKKELKDIIDKDIIDIREKLDALMKANRHGNNDLALTLYEDVLDKLFEIDREVFHEFLK